MYWAREAGALAAFTVLAASNLIAATQPPPPETNVRLEILATGGTQTRILEALDSGDSLSLRLQGLRPGQGVQIYLNDDQGREWSYARLFAGRKGEIPATLFWYQSGVIGTSSRKIDFKPEPAFRTFEEADACFTRHPLRLSVRDLEGRVLTGRPLRVRPRTAPLLYPSNAQGVLTNAVDLRHEDLYATGTHFPAGATVHLYTVPNRYTWRLGDPLVDQTGSEGRPEVETVRLAAGQTRFTVKVWDHRSARPGAYDLVARVGRLAGLARLQASDVLAYNDDTAVLYYVIVNGNVVIDTAGRTKGSPAYFEFSDSFEKGQDVYAAVDPTDVPASHPGGNYAKYWVVAHQPESYWDGAAPALNDVSGGAEIHRVKYWCINGSVMLVWPGATQAEASKDYDVVVDFGAVPANDAASFVDDNTYNKGTDFIDSYGVPGFSVFEDPSTVGPYPVGTVELNEPNGISGITDPSGTTGPAYNVTLAWARIMYPATVAGTGTPVNPAKASYPVAVFLHGRHWNCDADGSGPGTAPYGSGYSYSCPVADRIPSHEGYNYIMERLASQGIFAVSISAHDIQPDNGIWNYNARGRLVLKFLDKLRDWTASGSDPFGGVFHGKLDMTKVALSGHSRGGEGVVAAAQLNLTWPNPHSILAVNAIAPTDQNGTSYVPTAASYYLLVGARDGDVSNMQGFRTYDRAYPDGAAVRRPKAVAWVYGANHNYFNTIWTDTAALGSANPWAGARDDASWITYTQSLTAAQQRQVALTTITAFFRRHLQGIEAYREILTGRLRPAAVANDYVFRTYQDDVRKALDSFEQTPLNASLNTLGGAASAPGFTTAEERLLNADSTDYPSGLPQDSQFFHDTIGLKLGWATGQTYTTELPAGKRDVSGFSHLNFRAAKKVTGAPGAGPDLNLLVNIEDGAGHKSSWDMSSSQFDRIPHPYNRSDGNKALMVGVRIPLRSFTKNNSGVDLTDVARVTIKTTGAGEIGMDDIEFGK